MNKTFTEEQRQRFQTLKMVARHNDRTTQKWIEALIEIDENEYWKIDNSRSMHAWAVEQCPLSYTKIISAMKRLQERANERLIEETTGEEVISRSHKTKTEHFGHALDTTGLEYKNDSSPPEPKTAKVTRDFYYVDKTNHPIPESLEPVWFGRAEVTELIDRIRGIIDSLGGYENPAWIGCNIQKIQTDLTHLCEHLRLTMPYALCPKCSGRLPKCDWCHGRGFIGKLGYETQTPRGDKSIREQFVIQQNEKLHTQGLSARS